MNKDLEKKYGAFIYGEHDAELDEETFKDIASRAAMLSMKHCLLEDFTETQTAAIMTAISFALMYPEEILHVAAMAVRDMDEDEDES